MLELAANLSTLFTELPLIERPQAAADAGFRVAEFQFPYDVPAPELARSLVSSGLQVALINAPAGDLALGERGLVLSHDEPAWRHSIERAISYALMLGAPRVHVLTGRAPDLDEPTLELAGSRLRWAARMFEKRGLLLLLEALNPHDEPGYALSSLEAAEELRVRIGMDNVLLQYDAYHLRRMGRDPSAELPGWIDRVGHIQMAGAPDRDEPDGQVDRDFLNMVSTLGYTGPVGCEYRPRSGTLAGLNWAEAYGVKRGAPAVQDGEP